MAIELQFVKTSPKLLKNIALKEVQRNQCVIGIRARASSSQTANLVMQTLVEVLKTLNAAAVTGCLGQLCEDGMSQALHHQGLMKSKTLLPCTEYIVDWLQLWCICILVSHKEKRKFKLHLSGRQCKGVKGDCHLSLTTVMCAWYVTKQAPKH